jgi:hypothetical protein
MVLRDVTRLHTVSYVGLHTRQVRYVGLHPAKLRGAGHLCPFLEVVGLESNRNLSTALRLLTQVLGTTAGVNVAPVCNLRLHVYRIHHI